MPENVIAVTAFPSKSQPRQIHKLDLQHTLLHTAFILILTILTQGVAYPEEVKGHCLGADALTVLLLELVPTLRRVRYFNHSPIQPKQGAEALCVSSP